MQPGNEFSYLNPDDPRYDFDRIIRSIQKRAFKESIDIKKWIFEPSDANPVEEQLYTELFFAQQEQRFPLPLEPLSRLPLVNPPLNTRTSAEDIEITEERIEDESAALAKLTPTLRTNLRIRFETEDDLASGLDKPQTSKIGSQLKNARNNAVISTRIKVADLREIPKEIDMREAFPDLNILNRLFGLAWEGQYYQEAWYFWAYQVGIRYQLWTATHPLRLILMISLDKTFRRKFKELWQNILPRLKQEWNIPDVPYLCKKWTPGIRFLTLAVFVLPFTYPNRRTYWLSPGQQGLVAQEETMDWQTFQFREAASMLGEVKKADLWPNKWSLELSPEWHTRQEQTYSAAFLAEDDWEETPQGTSKELTSYRVQARLPAPVPNSGIHIEKTFNLYPEELDLYLDELPRKLAAHTNKQHDHSQESIQNNDWTSRDWEEKFPFAQSLSKVRYYAVPAKELGFSDSRDESAITLHKAFDSLLQKGTVQTFRELRHNLLLEYLEYRGALLGEDPISGQLTVGGKTHYVQRRHFEAFKQGGRVFEEAEFRNLRKDLKKINRNKKKLLRKFLLAPVRWSNRRSILFKKAVKPENSKDYIEALKEHKKVFVSSSELDDLVDENPHQRRGILYKEFRTWLDTELPNLLDDPDMQKLLFKNSSEAGQLFTYYYQMGTNRFKGYQGSDEDSIILFEPFGKQKRYKLKDRLPLQQVDFSAPLDESGKSEKITFPEYYFETDEESPFAQESKISDPSSLRSYPYVPMRYPLKDPSVKNLAPDEFRLLRESWEEEVTGRPTKYNSSLYGESRQFAESEIQIVEPDDTKNPASALPYSLRKSLTYTEKTPATRVKKDIQDSDMTSLTREKFNFLKAYVKTILEEPERYSVKAPHTRKQKIFAAQELADVQLMGRTFGTNTRFLRRRANFKPMTRFQKLKYRTKKLVRRTGDTARARYATYRKNEAVFKERKHYDGLSNFQILEGTYQVPVQVFQPNHLAIPDSFYKARKALIEFWNLSPEVQAQLGLDGFEDLDQETSSPIEILSQMRQTVKILSTPIHSLKPSSESKILMTNSIDTPQEKVVSTPVADSTNWWDLATSHETEVSKDIFKWVAETSLESNGQVTVDSYHKIMPRPMSGHQYPGLTPSRIKELLVSRYWFRNSFAIKRVVRVPWQLFPTAALKTTLKSTPQEVVSDTSEASIQTLIHTDLLEALQRIWSKETCQFEGQQPKVSHNHILSLDHYRDWLIGQALIQPPLAASSNRINENNTLLHTHTRPTPPTQPINWQEAFFLDDVLMPLGRKPRKTITKAKLNRTNEAALDTETLMQKANLKEIPTHVLEGKYLSSQRNLFRYRQMMLQRLIGTVRLMNRYNQACDQFTDHHKHMLPQLAPYDTLPYPSDSPELVLQTIGTLNELKKEFTNQITFLQDWLQQCDEILAKPSAFQLKEDFRDLHVYRSLSKATRAVLMEERYRTTSKRPEWRNPELLDLVSLRQGEESESYLDENFNRARVSQADKLELLRFADSQQQNADRILLNARKKYQEILEQWNQKTRPAFVEGNERLYIRNAKESLVSTSTRMYRKRLEDQILDCLANKLPASTFQAYGVRLTNTLLSNILLAIQHESNVIASVQLNPEANPDLSWLLKKLDELKLDDPSADTFETLWAQFKDVSNDLDKNALYFSDLITRKAHVRPSSKQISHHYNASTIQLGIESLEEKDKDESSERHLDELTETSNLPTFEDRWEDLSQLEELVDQFHTHTVSMLGLFEGASNKDKSRQFDDILNSQFPNISDAISRSPAQHRLWERWSLQSSSFLHQTHSMGKSLSNVEVQKTGMQGPLREEYRLHNRTNVPLLLAQPDWYGLMGSPGISPIINWHHTNYDRHAQWADVRAKRGIFWANKREDLYTEELWPFIVPLKRNKSKRLKELKKLKKYKTLKRLKKKSVEEVEYDAINSIRNMAFESNPSQIPPLDSQVPTYLGLDLKNIHSRVSLIYNKIDEASETLQFKQSFQRRPDESLPHYRAPGLRKKGRKPKSKRKHKWKLKPPSLRSILIGRRTNQPRFAKKRSEISKKLDLGWKTLVKIPYSPDDQSRNEHFDDRKKRDYMDDIPEPMRLYVKPLSRFSENAREEDQVSPRKKVVRIVQKAEVTQYPETGEPKGFGRHISQMSLLRIGWMMKLIRPMTPKVRPEYKWEEFTSDIPVEELRDLLDDSAKGIIPAPEERVRLLKPRVAVRDLILRHKPWRQWTIEEEAHGPLEVSKNLISVLNSRILHRIEFYFETFLDKADPNRYDRLREMRSKICESIRSNPPYEMMLDLSEENVPNIMWHRQRNLQNELFLNPLEKLTLDRLWNDEQLLAVDDENASDPYNLGIKPYVRQAIGSVFSANRVAKEFHYFYLMRLSMLEPGVWVGADKQAYYRMWPHDLQVQIESLILAIYTTEQFGFMGLQIALLLAKEIATLKNILGAVSWSTLVLLGLVDPTLIRSYARKKDRFRIRVYRTKKRLSQMSGVEKHMVVSEDALIYLQLHQIGFRLLGFHHRFRESHYIPKGFIMGGPPGTGKTFFAQAFAGDAKVPIVTVGPSDLVHSRVGVVLTRLRGTFAMAHQEAPCVLFLDEMEAIGRQRIGMPKSGLGKSMAGLGSALWAAEESAFDGKQYVDRGTPRIGEPTDRESAIMNVAEVQRSKVARDSGKLLLEFILQIDKMDRDKGVVLMGATNFPQYLDAALMRPGRLDRSLEFKRPNVRERLILLDFLGVNPMRMDMPVGYFLGRTQGLSQSDLATMMNEARLEAVYSGSTFGIEMLELVYERVKVPHLIKERHAEISYAKQRANPHWIFHNVFHEVGQAIVHTFLPEHAPIFFLTRGKNPTPTMILPLSDRPMAYSAPFIEASIQGHLAGQAGQFIGLATRRDTAGLPSVFLKHYNLRLTAEDIECATVLAYFLAIRSGIYSNHLDIMNQLRYDTNVDLDGQILSPRVAMLIEEAWAPWRETWGYLDLDEDLFHRSYPYKVERWISVHPVTGQPIGNQFVESYQWVEWCYSRSSIAADARRMDHVNPLSGTRDSKWKDVLSYNTAFMFRFEGNHGASTNQLYRIYSDVYITTLLRLGYEGASSLIQERLELFDYLAMSLLLRSKIRSFELVEFIENFGDTLPDKSLLYDKPNIFSSNLERSIAKRSGFNSDLTFRSKTVNLETFTYNTFHRNGRELFQQYREKEFAQIRLSNVQTANLTQLIEKFEQDQVLCLSSQAQKESFTKPSVVPMEITDVYLEAAQLQVPEDIAILDEKLTKLGRILLQIEQQNPKVDAPELMLLKCIWHEWVKTLCNLQDGIDSTDSLRSEMLELPSSLSPDTLKSLFLTEQTFGLITDLDESLEKLREFYQLKDYEDNDVRLSLAKVIDKFPNSAIREDFTVGLIREWKFKSQNRITFDNPVLSPFLQNFEEPANPFWSRLADKNGPFEICEQYAVQAGITSNEWYEICEQILEIQNNIQDLVKMWFLAHFGALQLHRDCLNHWQELNQYDHPTIFTDFFHTPRRGDEDYQPPN